MFDWLRAFLVRDGYWAVALVLLLENAGLPVPGETTLLLASFLAFSEHRLRLHYLILVGILAATVGDNLGFFIGHYGGLPMLDRYRETFRLHQKTILRGEQLFARYGAATILISRFIAGMRVIAGPLAGVLRMPWRRFLIFNFLGAALWVSAVSLAGYFSGEHWDQFASLLEDLNLGAFAALALLAVLFLLWRLWRHSPAE
jgi:membrane protein DedA with SNARE-associated domain